MWKCKRCVQSDNQRQRRSDSKQRRDSKSILSSVDGGANKLAAKVLPYDVSYCFIFDKDDVFFQKYFKRISTLVIFLRTIL